MVDAAFAGLYAMIAPWPLFFLFFGVMLGVWGGAMPGVGGPSQLAMLLPFAMIMEPMNSIAFLIGVACVGNTGNTFTSILIAVPGGSGSQATVLDGYPMARKGEAKRALSASFMSSMLGGLIGALFLFISIPLMKPLMRSFGSPELFMFTLWGLSMVGVMSSGAPLKGLTAGVVGVLLSTVGQDEKSGVMRFDFGEPYLWNGISIVLISLSVFAIPEVIGMASRKAKVAEVGELTGTGIWQGVKDCFIHWWLLVRCSLIGVWVGILPGLGSAVADWFAYAHARQTEKNNETFGRGDVRGVIGPEASNNAKEGGDLIPTLLFGIPGGSSAALLLVAFVAVGLRPGPDMIVQQLDYIFAILWALIFSQILASAVCWALIKPAAKICLFPFFVLVPTIVALSFLSAFAATFSFADIITLMALSLFGYLMKANGWPRAPLVLGFILGTKMELYLWLSVARYDMEWVWRPGVILLGLLILGTYLYPVLRKAKKPAAADAAVA
jgi:putative tricarboxylic transport membrane protein